MNSLAVLIKAGVTSLVVIAGVTSAMECADVVAFTFAWPYTAVLKIAVNNVKLEILESRDYLPKGSQSRHKPTTFNRDFYVKNIAVITSVQIVECLFPFCLIHAHTCLKRSFRLRPLRHHKFHNGYCNIGLCDSRDYFASPLLIVQTD